MGEGRGESFVKGIAGRFSRMREYVFVMLPALFFRVSRLLKEESALGDTSGSNSCSLVMLANPLIRPASSSDSMVCTLLSFLMRSLGKLFSRVYYIRSG